MATVKVFFAKAQSREDSLGFGFELVAAQFIVAGMNIVVVIDLFFSISSCDWERE